MGKYERILVPLDGSEVSECVLSEVEKLATCFKASISIMRAAYAHVFPGADPAQAEVAVIKEAEEYVHRIEKQLKAKGFKVDSHVRYGDAAEEILAHCDQYNIDLIAMCTRGRSRTKLWLLGSVAEKVVTHAKIPIFLVRFKR